MSPEVGSVHAGNALKRAAANPVIELLERLGYVARGVLYGVTGLLALGLALGIGVGQDTDLTGSLVFLIGTPFGKLLLVVMAVGLAAYSLWGFIRALYDPLHRGSDASGYVARLGFLTSALSYGAIVIFALQLLAGSGGGGGESTQKTIASILTTRPAAWSLPSSASSRSRSASGSSSKPTERASRRISRARR